MTLKPAFLCLILSTAVAADLPDSPLVTDDSPACERSLWQYMLATEPWPDNTCAIDTRGVELLQKTGDGFLIKNRYYAGSDTNYIPKRGAFLKTRKPLEKTGLPEFVVYIGTYRYTTVTGFERTVMAFKPYVPKGKRH